MLSARIVRGQLHGVVQVELWIAAPLLHRFRIVVRSKAGVHNVRPVRRPRGKAQFRSRRSWRTLPIKNSRYRLVVAKIRNLARRQYCRHHLYARPSLHSRRLTARNVDPGQRGLAIFPSSAKSPCLFRRHAVGDNTLAVGRPLGTAAESAMLGDTLETAAVGVDQIHVNHVQALPAALGGAKIAIAVRGEGNPFSVGRPGGTEIAAVSGGEWDGLAAGDIEDKDVGFAGGACGYEDDLLAVWRECGLIVVGGVVGEAIEAGAIGMDAVEIGRAGALGGEDNPVSDGRPGVIVVKRGGLGERAFRGAIGIGDEE